MKQKTMLRIVILLCIITMGITYVAPHFYTGKKEYTVTRPVDGSHNKDTSGEVIIWHQMLYQHLFTFN